MTGEKILIVNDVVSEAIAIRQILRKNKFDIAGLVIDIVDAIQEAGENTPDLVLMKIGVSGSMGVIDAASKIIANYNLPVLFIVGDDDIELVNHIKKINNPVILFQPFKESDLIKSINTAINRHVAETKMREEKARANIDPIQTKLDSVEAPAITINKRGAITRVNRQMEFLTKFKKTELIGRKFLSFIDAKDRIEYININGQAIDDEENVEIWPNRVSLKNAEGSASNVLVISGFIKTYGDNLDEQVLIFKKITGDIEFATRGMDIIFSKVMNSLDDMVFVINKDFEITHYNTKFLDFTKRLGITNYQLSQPIYEIAKFSKIGAVNMYEELFRTNSETTQVRKYGSDKESLYMYFHFIPIMTNGVTTNMITVMRDITELEETRQKSKAIYDEFMQNRSLVRNIQGGISEVRKSMYQVIKFVEKSPDTATNPTLQQVSKLTKNVEQKLLSFDVVWSKYEKQLNMLQMNAKYKYDKK
ncbi:MAG: PAS domain S-box protein [Methanomicrobium sp.]|nr:PAS domain S-box protein [Methanomicrobium sp.]